MLANSITDTQTADGKKIASLTIERLPLSVLKPHPQNPRTHPEIGDVAWTILEKSLEHDYFDPIVWNRRNRMLVSGHLRTKILAAKGYSEADCVVVDYDDQMHLARMTMANQLQGETDRAILREIMESLDTGAFDMDLTGLDSAALEELMTAAPPESPEVEFSMTLMEKNNYVVLIFRNEIDWLAAQTHFRLTTVCARRANGKPWAKGIGRVIDGATYLAERHE